MIASASVRRPLVTVETVRAALRTRRSRPLFFIDIAVPRNVDEAVSALGNAFCYDVDHLQGVVAANLLERQREAARAEVLVTGEVDKFLAGLRDRDVVPTIVSLRRRVEAPWGRPSWPGRLPAFPRRAPRRDGRSRHWPAAS